MTASAWLEDLALNGWRFWMEGDRLRFRAPSSQANDLTLDRLRDAKPDIIRLLREQPDALAIAPLSYGQRALWFLWRLAPSSHAYNQSLALRVGGISEEAPWRAACQALTVRHAMLRTSFPARAGEPFQRVHAPTPVSWRRVNVRGESDVAVRRAIAFAHECPFDLAAAPAVRFAWIDAAPDPPVLLVTLHHVACDGWSLELMRRDLVGFAEAAAAGRPPGASPPAHTYHDFVWWQRDLLAGPEGDRLWEFWRSHLSPPPARLELPTDRPRPRVQTYAGEAVRFDISAELTRELRAIAEAEQVTLYMLLLAMFQAVLWRWTGQHDLVIGTPTAGRTLAAFTPVVGYFVDPLVIRAAMDPSESFIELLRRVRRIAQDAMEHRDFPFALLVERLRVDRDPGRSPLFDVTFNFLNRRATDRVDHRRATSADLQPIEIEQADGKFDLTLTVFEDDHSMTGALGFNADLFHRATIERVAAWIRAAMEGICADPAVTIDAIPLGSAALTPVLSGRRLNIASRGPVHRHIAEHARIKPGAAALVAADRTLSFGALHAACGHLADTLRRHAVGSGDAVAIFSGRSSSFIVGLFAVLEAGGAFVPIDPEFPATLVRSMFERACVKVILVERGLEGRLPATDVPVVPIEIDTAARTAGEGAAAVSLDDVAYIIFTSGSTGAPKGVAVTHRSLANYVASIVDDLAIEPACRFAFVSTVAADLGHTAIFPALATGGTIHVLPEHAVTNPGAFAAYLTRHDIDYLKIVPSHLAALLTGLETGRVCPLRAVFFGGESTSVSLVERFSRLHPACRFFNHYGPTETTVGVMTYAVDSRPLPGTATLPLGRAVANTDIYLVDPQGASVPPGIPGEVYITGVALSRGYVGDDVATAERFVMLGNGERAYRTGDLARQLPDGTLLLLGRADRQINCHGYRVEPGQIEAVLAEHPMVRHAVALLDADGEAARTIVLWLVPADGSPAIGLEQALRDLLASRLPRHMVPGRIVLLDEMPLTRNGKIDVQALRRGLPAASRDAASAGGAPRDATEARLADIWADALGSSPIGLDDDFFDAGGHSLLAVRVAARVEQEFGIEIPLSAFFTHRTVRALARRLKESERATSLLVPIDTRGEGAPLFCVAGAGGSLLYFHELASRLGGVRPVWGLQTVWSGGRALESIEEIAGRYVHAVREAHPAGPYFVTGHSFGALVAYEMARQFHAAGAAVGLVSLLDNAAPGVDGSFESERDDAAWLMHIATRIGKLYGMDLRLRLEDLAGDNGADRLVGRLQEAGAFTDVGTAQFRRFVDVYKANVRASARYRPSASPLAVPMALFRAAQEDPELGAPRDATDSTLGWSRYSGRAVVVREVPGTHITMLKEPHVAELAAGLNDLIDQQERVS